jgi:hypothetical protein
MTDRKPHSERPTMSVEQFETWFQCYKALLQGATMASDVKALADMADKAAFEARRRMPPQYADWGSK